jgi:hypothetical protein
MNVSLLEAAKLAGVSKSAIYKQIKRGVLSGVRDDVSGQWMLDVAELQRVYELRTDHSPARNTPVDSPLNDVEVRLLRELVRSLESERDYLRQRLDAEGNERQRVTLLLTGPRTDTRTGALLFTVSALLVVAVCAAVLYALGFRAF